MTEDKIRVFCVDDDKVITKLYQLILDGEEDFEFAGSSTTTDGLLQTLEESSASVLLVDLLIPGVDTLKVIADLHLRLPSLVILVATGLEKGEVIDEAFRSGARGIYLKVTGLVGLISTIRRAVVGTTSYSEGFRKDFQLQG